MEFWKSALTAILLIAASAAAHAQDYPSKPVRIVVPYPPGGIADTLTRAVGDELSKRIGQPVLIDNKPGGRQIIGTETVAKAAPDGHTLLLGSITSLSLNPASIKKLPYSVERDLAPVSRLFHAPLLLVVTREVPAKTVKELVAFSKANPGKLSYASIGPGSSTHIAGELLKAEAGLDMVHVPYKGSAPAVVDLIGGQVQLMFDGGTSSMPHVATGNLKLLAVTASKRFPYLPDIPTMAESGLPGYDVTAWWGIMAPAGTPKAITERLARELGAIADSKEFRDRFGKDGVALETDTPEQFARFIEAETTRWTNFFKTSGISFDN